MNFLLILFLICVAIYCCFSWLFPTLLAWLFKRKYHINLKIGRIAFPKLILRDVSLSKDRYSIHINEVSLKSSFFNSDIHKLVWVVIRGLEITNNVEEKRSVVVETILKPLLSKQNSSSKSDGVNDDGKGFNVLNRQLGMIGHRKVLDFRDKKLPPSLIMFAQFMGVHIFDLSVNIQNGSLDSGWSLHASASEVHADGAAGGPARALVFSANLVHATAKVVKGVKCLAEASCSLLIEGTVKAEGPLNVEKIHASISNIVVMLQDDLYDFIQKHKKYRRPSVVSKIDSEDHMDTFVARWSPVVPKIFSLKVDKSMLGCTDNITNTTFAVSLQSVQVNSRFSAASLLTNSAGTETTVLPQLYVAVQMDEFKVTTAEDQIIYLNMLKLDAKLEKGVLNLYLILSTLSIY